MCKWANSNFFIPNFENLSLILRELLFIVFGPNETVSETSEKCSKTLNCKIPAVSHRKPRKTFQLLIIWKEKASRYLKNLK